MRSRAKLSLLAASSSFLLVAHASAQILPAGFVAEPIGSGWESPVGLCYLDEQRQMSLYGRYSLNPDWALTGETLGQDASGLFRLQDFRIGVQRRF